MNNTKIYHRVHLSLIFALCVFLIMFFTMLFVSITMHFISALGYNSIDHFTSIVIFVISSLLVGVILSILTAHIPLKPLYSIINATNKIANGDYTQRINLKGPLEMKQLSNSFNHMAKELQSVEMLRNDFVNNFAHEFKTPIVSIRGFAKMLKRKDISQNERDEYLNIIISESDRLTELAMNVLNLSNIEKQSILSDKTKVNISEQIRQAIVLLDCKWSEKHINFNFDCEEQYVLGSEKLLKQVWINILDNAIKFSDDYGDIDIDIESELKYVYIYLKNYGEPMTAKTQKFIFDKFYQGDKSHTTKGNGLGLTIAKRIIELHNGKIRVKESNDSNTIFEVKLLM